MGARLNYSECLSLLHDLVDLAPRDLVVRGGEISWGASRVVLSRLFPEIQTDLKTYLDELPEEPPDYVVVLMRAGTASLGFFVEGELEAHKVIRKYMVRKSQGRMQIAYLNAKGKSRAGSRVRLRESVEFFEEINAKLTDWFEEFGDPGIIFHSCPVRLKSYWFGSKVEPPFTSEDERLVHIPHHVHQPDHEELLRVNDLISLSETLDSEE